MLKGLDPILGPELLSVLRAMGHGDDIVIADANFPGATMAGDRPLIRLDGLDAVRILDAVLSVMPLDDLVPEPALRMQVVGAPDEEMPVFEEFRRVIAAREGAQARLGSLERFAFYERARGCFAVIVSGERRLYGNIILKKGVIRPT